MGKRKKNLTKIKIPVAKLKEDNFNPANYLSQRLDHGFHFNGYKTRLEEAVEVARIGYFDSLNVGVVYITETEIQYRQNHNFNKIKR